TAALVPLAGRATVCRPALRVNRGPGASDPDRFQQFGWIGAPDNDLRGAVSGGKVAQGGGERGRHVVAHRNSGFKVERLDFHHSRLPVSLRIEPADQLPVVEDRQRIVAVLALRGPACTLQCENRSRKAPGPSSGRKRPDRRATAAW